MPNKIILESDASNSSSNVVNFDNKAQASVLCGFRIPFQLVYEGV